MKRQYKETRKYDIFGEVRMTFEFMGDINDTDFKVFKRDYLCKKEKDSYTLRKYPKTFYNQAIETERRWRDENTQKEQTT